MGKKNKGQVVTQIPMGPAGTAPALQSVPAPAPAPEDQQPRQPRFPSQTVQQAPQPDALGAIFAHQQSELRGIQSDFKELVEFIAGLDARVMAVEQRLQGVATQPVKQRAPRKAPSAEQIALLQINRQKWFQYRQQFPTLVVGNKPVNKDHWQAFFEGKQVEAPAPAPQVPQDQPAQTTGQARPGLFSRILGR